MNILDFFKNILINIIKIPKSLKKYFLIGFKSIFFSFPLQIFNKITKKEKKIPHIILILSITTYLLCIFILTRWYVQTERTKKFSNSIINQELIEPTQNNSNEYQDINTPITNDKKDNYNNQQQSYKNINLNYYINKNSDTVGWLKIDGTNINYPVVQCKDNDYYLNHDFYKRKTNTGWIFADYRNNFNNLNNNTIIYGHNLVNKTMFGNIPDFLNEKWLNKKNKPYINLTTKKANTTWQIFSIYKIKPTTDYLQTQFNSFETYKNFIEKIKNRSIKNFNIEILPTDKIITLSTCDNSGKYRVVVHAKLININNK